MGRLPLGGDAPPAATPVNVARSGPGASASNKVVAGLPKREIYVFEGAEFIDMEATQNILRDPPSLAVRFPSSINRYVRDAYRVMNTLPPLALEGGPYEVELTNPLQGLTFKLHFRRSILDLKAALERQDVGVIYQGHARHGRGPCFGPRGRPQPPPQGEGNTGDFWNDGDGMQLGIFRMGYDYLSVPQSEIVEHGYHTDIAKLSTHALAGDLRRVTNPWSLRTPPFIWEPECDPDMRAHYPALVQNQRSQYPKTMGALDAALSQYLPAGTQSTEEVHAYRARERKQLQDFVVLSAGARHLRETTVRCRFFAHLGCSTLAHNAAIFRTHVTQAGGARYAVWTTQKSWRLSYLLFLHKCLTFPKPAANDDWLTPLCWATEETNRLLTRAHQSYQLEMA